MTEARVVFVTGPDSGTLHAIARSVIEERLAACVNILPAVESVYRWDGEVQEEREAMAMIKTTRDLLPALERRVVDLHPYDTPEFVALSVETGAEAYLTWIARSVAEHE